MAGKKVKRFKGVKGLIILFFMACLIIGYYFYLSNRPISNDSENNPNKISKVQEVLLRDLEKNYPPSPKEVVKYYAEITKCFYNEELSESDIYDLGMRARELYDAELIASNEESVYLEELKSDIQEFNDGNIKISSANISSSVDVDYFMQDGYEWARLYCNYSIRQGTSLTSSNHLFLLRKDEEGHYKIFGWDLAD